MSTEFEWGKKKGVGGKKKEAQFYESFTYDNSAYSLYDNVYLYKEGEPEPYIGKLVKIWEQAKIKKVKILWFFRPIEISNWIEDGTVVENEVFLASGDGPGLANINPLEAIAGKCHVVCTSKDSRNPQPSQEELRRADYIFYRTFDVRSCTISEQIADTIAGVEVRSLFNREGVQRFSGGPELDAAEKEENGNLMASNGGSMKKKDGGLKAPVVNKESSSKEDIVPDFGPEHVASIPNSYKNAAKTDSIPVSNVEPKKLKSSNDLGAMDDRPSKKARLDGSVKLPEEASISHTLPVQKDKNENILQKKQRVRTEEDDVLQASLEGGGADDDNKKNKPFKEPPRPEKASLKLKPDERATKVSNGKQLKATPARSPEKNLIPQGKELEVTRKPETGRSKWFEPLPWAERMKAAQDQGTLVLLENLDPAYSSAEIEDIVWSGFRESCEAKVVPHTSISRPHSGQAFVIFKTRDAADTAVRKLKEGCLMLPNGRPLVASFGTAPSLPVKSSTFVGHLIIDKIKMHREEQKQAISTSHCSQPNTIEYDMAMEWRLLQTRQESMMNELYKRQGEELRKLKAGLNSK